MEIDLFPKWLHGQKQPCWKKLRHREIDNRAVFKWLSKVITWLRLLRLVIGLKDSRQFFNQREAKPKQITPCTSEFSRASSELQVIARNCDWFMTLFVPVVIGRSNCFGFGFSTVIWKPLYRAYLIGSRTMYDLYRFLRDFPVFFSFSLYLQTSSFWILSCTRLTLHSAAPHKLTPAFDILLAYHSFRF